MATERALSDFYTYTSQIFSRFAVEQGEHFEIAIRKFWCHHTAVRRLWGMGDDT